MCKIYLCETLGCGEIVGVNGDTACGRFAISPLIEDPHVTIKYKGRCKKCVKKSSSVNGDQKETAGV